MTDEDAQSEAKSQPKRWYHVLAYVLFAAGALGVTAYAVAKHKRAREARETIAKLQAGLNALQPKGRTDLHATLNGVVSHITFTSSPRGLADAANAVADTCGNDAETGGGEVVSTGDAPGKRFVREMVHRDEAADGSAISVLCIFRSADTGERFERWSFLRGDAHSSSATSVTRQSKADLTEMFPTDRDAPGDDLAGVPRPEGTRRIVAASVVETGHAVRIYEVPRKGPEDVRARREAFDRQMRAAGYEPSKAVSEVLEDTRLYVRGADRIVVAFEPFGEVTRIVINRTDLL